MEFDDQEPTPKKEPLNCIDNNSKVPRDINKIYVFNLYINTNKYLRENIL